MKIREDLLTGDVQGTLLTPELTTGLGVVVLHGSSGTVDVSRARLFAATGAIVLALHWFGGNGQVPVISEVPLETFTGATDLLVEVGCERIAYVGTSRGAEAAILAAIDDPRIDTVVAISPSLVVWAGDSWPPRSSWTRNGIPLPFVHYDVSQFPPPSDGPVSYRRYAEKSLERFAGEVPAATIPIEKARARVVLVAGGDDALWPSDVFARALADRLEAAGKQPLLITHPEAGHRALLPGDATPRSAVNAHGGTDAADRALGLAAWKAISELLHLSSSDGSAGA
jgi:uncharacterized protein